MKYICSFDMLELIICLLFAGLGYQLPYLWEPSDRMGVPHTGGGTGTGANNNNGDANAGVSFDLTFDRSSTSETVTTTSLVLLGIALPLLLQCLLAFLDERLKCQRNHEGHGMEAGDGLIQIIARSDDDNLEGKDSETSNNERDAEAIAENSTMSYYFLHATICTYSTTMGMSLLFTESIKRYVGYMRPNFYQLCQPEYGSESGEWICNEEASGDTDIERYQSFPSGHASVCYAGLTLLSLFLNRFFGFSRDGNTGSKNANFLSSHLRLRRMLCFISVLLIQSLALWISTSRIANQVHHPADVVGGSVMGAGCAYFVEGLWL